LLGQLAIDPLIKRSGEARTAVNAGSLRKSSTIAAISSASVRTNKWPRSTNSIREFLIILAIV
jgi:hypothetical protein